MKTTKLVDVLTAALEETLQLLEELDSKSLIPRVNKLKAKFNSEGNSWTLKSQSLLSLETWNGWSSIYALKNVKSILDLLSSDEEIKGLISGRDRKHHFKLPEFNERDTTEALFREIVVSYVNSVGTIFEKDSVYQLIDEWLRYIRGEDLGIHVIVLNRFFLDGAENGFKLGDYLFRRLTEDEVTSLLSIGVYNIENSMNRIGNLQEGLSGVLSPKFCIELKRVTNELMFEPDEVYGFESELDKQKLQISSVLRIFKDTPLYTGPEIDIPPDFQRRYMPFSGIYSSANLVMNQLEPYYIIRLEELDSLRKVGNEFLRLDLNQWGAMSIAVRRLASYDLKSDGGDKLLDLVISLEALLGAGAKNEIAYRIAIRCAYFIGDDRKDRIRIFELVNFAYDVRSRIVHGMRKPLDTRKEIKKKYEIYSIYVLTTEIANIVRKVVERMSTLWNDEISKDVEYSAVHSSIIKGIDKDIVLGGVPVTTESLNRGQRYRIE